MNIELKKEICDQNLSPHLVRAAQNKYTFRASRKPKSLSSAQPNEVFGSQLRSQELNNFQSSSFIFLTNSWKWLGLLQRYPPIVTFTCAPVFFNKHRVTGSDGSDVDAAWH